MRVLHHRSIAPYWEQYKSDSNLCYIIIVFHTSNNIPLQTALPFITDTENPGRQKHLELVSHAQCFSAVLQLEAGTSFLVSVYKVTIA